LRSLLPLSQDQRLGGGRRMTSAKDFTMSCPLPAGDGGLIQLAHGGGGRAMARLLDTTIRAAFAEPILEHRHDGAVLDIDGPIAFTTDPTW
jgi:hydrogenase expression/formation protein HypE